MQQTGTRSFRGKKSLGIPEWKGMGHKRMVFEGYFKFIRLKLFACQIAFSFTFSVP